MSDAAVPARATTTAPVAPTPVDGEPRKLDDVLLAMDVVDTLRHRVRVVDAELNAEKREEQLIERLKEIYGAQGISVPEKILKDGVKALEEQRFVYKPPPDTFSVRLAKLYVSRKRWLPAATTFTGLVAALLVGWQVLWAMPQAAEWKAMPAEISELLAQGQALAVDPAVDAQLASIAAEGQRAVANEDRRDARVQMKTLEDMNEKLASEYDVRIVSRPGEDTGFIRVPDDNPAGQNFYIVVEAVAPGGRILTLPVTSEEDQTTKRVNIWAQRVGEDTFERIAEDKRGDQIIQNDILGRKARGELDPTFDEPVPGGAITEW
jgi:hypothetical protein